MSSSVHRFPLRMRMPWKLALMLWGVRPSTAYVDLMEDRLQIRYGPWRTATRLDNVARYDITGPYRWWAAIGPRRSVRNGDFSYGTSAHGGVCLTFHRAVRCWPVRPTQLTVTVDDLEGFAAALQAAGIPGADRRRSAARVPS